MRKPAQGAANASSNTFTVPAPTGGLNAIASLSDMQVTEAIFLDNYWPKPNEVQLRKGWVEFASVPTDLPLAPDLTPHDVRALLSYSPSNGTPVLFACDQTGIFNVTAGGSVAVAATPSTNGSWRAVNISTAGGKFLWACNGVDKPRTYNGTVWTLLDGTSTPALTGVTSTDIINVSLFKTRLIFIIKNTLDFGFLAVNSIAGAVSVFPLGAIFKKGGYLVASETWSIDGGNGIDDYCIFITSEGEVAVYQGTDPAVAANWSLVGVYYIGSPLSYDCITKVGGDLILLTVQGIFPLSKALGFATVNPEVALSYKIQPAFNLFVSEAKDLYGWQIVFFPEPSMLVVNVPYRFEASLNFIYSYQFVMNTMNGSWARFTNMASECWCVHDNKLFFAKHNKIYQAWTGKKDGTGVITGKAKQAFSKLGRSGGNKHVKMIKPLLKSSSAINLSLGFDVDFSTDATLQAQASLATSVSLWDVDKFDQAVWTGSLVQDDWRTVANEPGMWFSLNMRIDSTNAEVSWLATQYIAQPAGFI